jgi:hypothetical protein
MSTTIGELLVDLRADVARLSTDMTKGKDIVSRSAKEFQAVSTAITGYLSSIGVNAFAGYIKGAIDAGGALSDLSEKTGISAETLSSYEYAARMSGTTLDVVAGGLKKLSTNMVEASGGNKEMQAQFKALGISVTDSNGKLKTNEQVLREVSDRFAEMPNGAEKSAIAVRLLGKSGAEMIPMLNGGAAGLDNFKKTAEELGLVVKDGVVKEMEGLGDQFDTISLAGQGVARKLATEMMPAMMAITERFLEGAKQGGALNLMMEGLGLGFKALAWVALGALEVFQRIGQAFGAIGLAAKQFVTGDFSDAAETMSTLQNDMQTRNDDFAKTMTKLWSDEVVSQGEVKRAYDKSKEAIEGTSKAKSDHKDKTADVIKKLEDELKQLGMTKEEAEAYKKMTEAGTTANSAAGIKIIELVGKLEAEKTRRAAAKTMAEEQEKAVKAHEKAMGDELKAIDAAIGKEKIRRNELDLTRSELAELALAELEKTQAMYDGFDEYADEQLHLQARIDKQRELVDEIKSTELVEAHKKAAADTKKAWEDQGKDIEKSLTDSLMRGFDSGKSLATSLVDYVKNAFKSNVIKIALSATGLTASNFAAAGQAGAEGGGGLGFNPMSAFSSMYGSIAESSIGQMIGLSQVSEAGLGMTSLGSTIGTALPYLGAALAAYSLIKGFIGKSTPHMGGMSDYSAAGGLVTDKSTALYRDDTFVVNNLDSNITAQTTNLAKGAVGVLDGLAALFGKAGAYRVETGFADDKSGDGAWGALRISNAGGNLVDWKKGRDNWPGREFSDGETGYNQYTSAIGEGIRTAIDAMRLPDWAQGIITSLGSSPNLEQLAQAVQRIAQLDAATKTLNNFGGVFATIANSSITARESMIQLAGGLDQLIAKAQSFVQTYYSADEQTAIAAQGVLTALTAAGIDANTLNSKDDFRALVESLGSQIDNSPTARAQLATLLTIAPDFAKVADGFTEQKTTLEQLAAMAPEMIALQAVTTSAADASVAATEAAAEVTTGAIDAVNNSVQAGTTAVVAAIANMGTTISAAVATAVANASSASNAALADISSGLDAIDAAARLAAAAPGFHEEASWAAG